MLNEAKEERVPTTNFRVVVNQTRMDGRIPIFCAEMGDFVYYSQATGDVAVSATVRIYLTLNGGATGEGRFGTGIPQVTAFRDMKRTQGGLARAGGPDKPSRDMQLRAVTADTCWDGPNEVWAVDITNDTGAVANYLVVAEGAK
jgi:hypothetical protein